MITVVRHEWDGRQWHVILNVQEGVYHRPAYPVTVTYLGPWPPSAPELHDACSQALDHVIHDVAEAHLRKGSLPPGGLLVNWRALVDHRFSDDALSEARTLAEWLDSQVGTVSQGEGHGYCHPMSPSLAGERPEALSQAGERLVAQNV